MLMKYFRTLSLIFIGASQILGMVNALENMDSPDLINKFKENEKTYLKEIENPNNGTRDTIHAYHNYKIYNILKSKLSSERQKELEISQINWIKFRDAEFKLINNNWDRPSFGSSFAVSRGDYSSTIIKNRLMQLFHYSANYL